MHEAVLAPDARAVLQIDGVDRVALAKVSDGPIAGYPWGGEHALLAHVVQQPLDPSGLRQGCKHVVVILASDQKDLIVVGHHYGTVRSRIIPDGLWREGYGSQV